MLLNIVSSTDISSLLPSRKEKRLEQKKAELEQKKARRDAFKKGETLPPVQQKKSAPTQAKMVAAKAKAEQSWIEGRGAEQKERAVRQSRDFDASVGRERNRDYGNSDEGHKAVRYDRQSRPKSDDDYWGDAPSQDTRPKKFEDRLQERNKKLPMKKLAGPAKFSKKDNGSGSTAESLPVTSNKQLKSDSLTSADKQKERRIGGDATLLSEKTPFAGLGLGPLVVQQLTAVQFTQPTKIQAQAIPALLSGRDALCQAQTGSGKTLSYLLPVLQDLQKHVPRLTRDDGTYAIVLAPTRELVLQIEEVWHSIAKPFYWLIATTIMGGTKRQSEKARLRKGCHLVIGTPGRIVDHLGSTQAWGLGSVSWLILDEADRLLDLGFREPIQELYRELLERADKRPQCALVSATLSKKQIRDNVFDLSSLLLQNPVHIGFDGVQDVDDDDEEGRTEGVQLLLSDGAIMSNDHSDDDDGGDDTETTTSDSSDNSDSDSDDDNMVKNRLLGSSALRRKKITTRSDSSSSSSGSDSDSDDNNTTSLPTLDVADLSMNKLLPKHREKNHNHLGDTSHYTTEEEQKTALDTITTSFVVPKTLEQLYVTMSSRHRLVALSSFLRLRVFNAEKQGKPCKMIVFVSTCASVEFLHRIFQHAYWPDDSVNLTGRHIDEVFQQQQDNSVDDGVTGINSADIVNSARVQQMKGAQTGKGVKDALVNTQLWKLHGNMPQHLRTETYKRFCDAKEGILFSTDVAARGLDLPLVDWIVQYDPPEDTQDYVHRVGRTARIGHTGRAVLFLLESELGYLQVLQKMGTTLKEIPLATVLSGLHIGLPPKSPLLTTERPLGAILQKQLEKLTSLSTHLNILAKASYIAHVRGYAAYPKALKGIFHPRRLHLGEVAHSFALTETPSEITKNSAEIIRIADATINPNKAQRDMESKEQKQRNVKNKTSLARIAKKTEKKQQLSEFL